MSSVLHLRFLLAAAAVSWFPVHAASGDVEIWIRAFIPDSNNSGKAAAYIIPRPGHPTDSLVRILPTSGIPGHWMPSCYVTDKRGFSSDASTTSRVETKFTIIPVKDNAKIMPLALRTTADTTVEVKCADGSEIASAKGAVVHDYIGTPAITKGEIQVIGQVTGKNKLAAWGAGPSIDYSFDFKWNPWTGKLVAAVSYGSFPALEMYARVKEGAWTAVLRHAPTGSPWNLAGDGFGIGLERDVQTILLPSMEGAWQSTDPESRFKLDVVNGAYKLTERNAAGQILVSSVSSELNENGSLRIKRANDAQVLTFLGFQQSLKNEILARAPRPSYIDLSHESGLQGAWFGLLVIKDANAHLKEIIQPGDKPPKSFTFKQ